MTVQSLGSIPVIAGLFLICGAFLVFTLIRTRTALGKSERNAVRLSNKLSQSSEDFQRLFRHIEQLVDVLPGFAALVDTEKQLLEALFRNGSHDRLLPSAPGEARELLFRSPDEYSGILPEVRAHLSRSLDGKVELDDVISSADAAGRSRPIRVQATLIPVGRRVLVHLVPAGDQNAAPGREAMDNAVIRSILDETNLVQGLEKAVALLHADPMTGRDIGFCVSQLDSGSLRPIWSRGLKKETCRLVEEIPLVFGHAPSATAALLSREVKAGQKGLRDYPALQEENPGHISQWASFPIIASSGKVLGVFDLFIFEGGRGGPDTDAIANFLFVTSVLMERHQALSQIMRTARTDRLIKSVGEKLLAAATGQELQVLSDCLACLQTHSPLSSGHTGLIFPDEDGRLVCLGSLFEGKTWIPGNGQWLTEQFRQLMASEADTSGSGEARSFHELLSLVVSPDTAIEMFISRLPVRAASRQGGWSVFPLVSGHQLDGVLCFAAAAGITEEQNTLLAAVVPVFANHLVRTRLLRELERRARYDQLTGLYNRAHTEETLKAEVGRTQRYNNPLSVMLFDIDHFKRINDTHGHDVGDSVLREVANRVRRSLRRVDLVGRWGGEEFLVILAETDRDSAMLVAENLRQTVENGRYGIPGAVTVSVGVAQFCAGDSSESLVRKADQALYQAKRNGRNQVVTG